MNTAEAIYDEVQALPETSQQCGLAFVEFLVHRNRRDDLEWADGSLAMALRGMEDES